jgi:hypothetical protein
MPPRTQHSWIERTDDGAREFRATRFGGKWSLQSKLKSDDKWTYHEKPPVDILRALLDVLQRKYQRRRVSYDDVVSVEELLKRQ